MASRAVKDVLVGVYSLQSAWHYSGSAAKEGRKSSLLLECFPAWLSLPGWDFCCTPDMADAWAFKPNWETQSEPWLTVRAYFGFHLLRGHRDITITRQQNTHSGAQIWWRNVISSCMSLHRENKKKKVRIQGKTCNGVRKCQIWWYTHSRRNKIISRTMDRQRSWEKKVKQQDNTKHHHKF